MLIKEIISKYILNLLTTIHNNYPEQFTNINIDQEYKYILDTINFNILTTENINSNSDSNSNIKNSTTSVKRLVNENERCNARVWGFIYNNNNNNAEKIVKIDKIFIVDDYNDIDTDKFNQLNKYKSIIRYFIFILQYLIHLNKYLIIIIKFHLSFY